MKSTICTTRSQLKAYGFSNYQAKIITKNLEPISRINQVNIYCLREVITSIKKYLENPRITQKTKKSLVSLLSLLINQLNNVIPATFKTQKLMSS